MIASEEGLNMCGVDKSEAIEIIGLGEGEDDITKPPADLMVLSMNALTASRALEQAGIEPTLPV